MYQWIEFKLIFKGKSQETISIFAPKNQPGGLVSSHLGMRSTTPHIPQNGKFHNSSAYQVIRFEANSLGTKKKTPYRKIRAGMATLEGVRGIKCAARCKKYLKNIPKTIVSRHQYLRLIPNFASRSPQKFETPHLRQICRCAFKEHRKTSAKHVTAQAPGIFVIPKRGAGSAWKCS